MVLRWSWFERKVGGEGNVGRVEEHFGGLRVINHVAGIRDHFNFQADTKKNNSVSCKGEEIRKFVKRNAKMPFLVFVNRSQV